jgi:restriction endonuclease Mrr
MGRKQYQTFRTTQRRSTRSSGSGSGCLAPLIIIALVVIGAVFLIQFLQTPTGIVFIFLVIAAVIGIFLWRKHKKDQQRRAWLIQQQQQAAWQQQQQQIQWQQREWERQESERREREKIARMKSLGDVLVLTPREFEQLTGRILQQYGILNVQHTGGSGDLGVDLVGYDGNGNQIVVQCKRYAPGNSVGSPDIQKFIGMMHVHYQVQKGIFVTTSTFTQPAIDLANKHNIILIDGNRLIGLLPGLQQNMP